MSGNVPATTPAGWYPDPSHPGMQRYWDGQSWTQQQAPATIPSAPQPAYAGTAPQTSTYAILAIVFAFVFSPLGIVFGVMGRKEIDASNGMKTGRGLATAGMWIGIVSIALAIVWILLIMLLFVGAASSSSM